MNKTVTINISGIIFHIEEEAYEKLGKYLQTIRGYFKDSEGRDEIMSDIEARIAEMFQERTSPGKQVILMSDVDEVIGIMGQPEEFAGDSEQQEEPKKKEEPAGDDDNRHRYRRLYRDPDDRVIGGVCTGLAYYFGIDPVWVRIAFAVAFFVFGTGLLFYILLMIIIPKATTTAEKLEMRGESVNVDNISRTVKEDFEHMKKKVNEFGEEAKKYGRDAKERWRRDHRFSDAASDFFQGVFRVFGRILSFALIVFGVLFLIGVLTSMFGLSSFGHGSLGYIIDSVFPTGSMHTIAIIAFILLFGVPCIMMIYKGIRMVFRIEARHRLVGFVAIGLWFCGLGLGIWVITSSAAEFSEYNQVQDKFVLTNPKQDTLFLRVNIDPAMATSGRSHGNSHWHYREYDWNLWSIDDGNVKLGYPALHIEPADGDSFEVDIIRSSHGIQRSLALDYARHINYKISQNDSLLEFSSCFQLGKGDLFRDQQVDVTLRVPRGKVIFLHQSTRDILDDIDNLNKAGDHDMVNRRWQMTREGLVCLDTLGLENNVSTPIPVPFKPAPDTVPAVPAGKKKK